MPPVLLALGGVVSVGEEKLPCEQLLLWDPQSSTQRGQGKLETTQDPSVSMLEQPLGMHRVRNTSVGCWGDIWGLPGPLPSWQHRHSHLLPKKTAVDPESSSCP